MGNFRHTILNEMTLDGRYKSIPEVPLPVTEIIAQIKDSSFESKEQFKRIFFCYRMPSSNDLFCLEILSEAFRENHLNIFTEFVSIYPKIDISLKNIGSGKGRVSETGEHQGMKKWVMRFLRSKGILATEEISQLGYRVDVGCLKKQIFIECGDTEPRKIFEFLRHNLSIGIHQYNSEDIVWFKPQKSFIEFANSKAFGIIA